jgi:hypothetical protein
LRRLNYRLMRQGDIASPRGPAQAGGEHESYGPGAKDTEPALFGREGCFHDQGLFTEWFKEKLTGTKARSLSLPDFPSGDFPTDPMG